MAKKIVNNLVLFQEFLTNQQQYYNDNELALSRCIVGYRIEYFLQFMKLPSFEQLSALYNDLLIAIQTTICPIMCRSVSAQSITTKRDELLQHVTSPEFTWRTIRKLNSQGEKISLLERVSMQRLAVLCSTFGIADKFTCKNLRGMSSAYLSQLWLPDAELILAQPVSVKSLIEMREEAISLVYNLSLPMCDNDEELYVVCQELYATLPFHWQTGKHSNARFCVYWAEHRGRTISFDNPAMLLIVCAKHWMENLRTKKFPNDKFFRGNNSFVIHPVITFSQV